MGDPPKKSIRISIDTTKLDLPTDFLHSRPLRIDRFPVLVGLETMPASSIASISLAALL